MTPEATGINKPLDKVEAKDDSKRNECNKSGTKIRILTRDRLTDQEKKDWDQSLCDVYKSPDEVSNG